MVLRAKMANIIPSGVERNQGNPFEEFNSSSGMVSSSVFLRVWLVFQFLFFIRAYVIERAW
jgi:hypothetical protein